MNDVCRSRCMCVHVGGSRPPCDSSSPPAVILLTWRFSPLFSPDLSFRRRQTYIGAQKTCLVCSKGFNKDFVSVNRNTAIICGGLMVPADPCVRSTHISHAWLAIKRTPMIYHKRRKVRQQQQSNFIVIKPMCCAK